MVWCVGSSQVDVLEQAPAGCGTTNVLDRTTDRRGVQTGSPGAISRTNLAPTMSSAAQESGLCRWKDGRCTRYRYGVFTTQLELLKSFGIDEIVDYKTAQLDEVVKDIDVVLDTVGGTALDQSLKTSRKEEC